MNGNAVPSPPSPHGPAGQRSRNAIAQNRSLAHKSVAWCPGRESYATTDKTSRCLSLVWWRECLPGWRSSPSRNIEGAMWTPKTMRVEIVRISTSSGLSLARQVSFIAKSVLRLHVQKLRFAVTSGNIAELAATALVALVIGFCCRFERSDTAENSAATERVSVNPH